MAPIFVEVVSLAHCASHRQHAHLLQLTAVSCKPLRSYFALDIACITRILKRTEAPYALDPAHSLSFAALDLVSLLLDHSLLERLDRFKPLPVVIVELEQQIYRLHAVVLKRLGQLLRGQLCGFEG